MNESRDSGGRRCSISSSFGSLSESAMFSQRIVSVDFYCAPPIRDIDVIYSEFRGYEVKRVPVLRIFGATPKGQKTCAHVHCVFPYLYVLYDSSMENFEYRLAIALDQAINLSVGNKDSKSVQHVFKIVKVTGKKYVEKSVRSRAKALLFSEIQIFKSTSLYGYRGSNEKFLKIFLYNPWMVKKAAELLQEGRILSKKFQSYETHIPYELQFLMDFNLYGMNLVHYSSVKFRRAGGNSKYLISPLSSSLTAFTAGGGQKIWDVDQIPEYLCSPYSLDKMSRCELEVDVLGSDILVSSSHAGVRSSNPGIDAIWLDEIERRRQGEVANWSQITIPESQSRAFDNKPLSMEEIHLKTLWDNVAKNDEEINETSSSTNASANSTIPSSQLYYHTPSNLTFADEVRLSSTLASSGKGDDELLNLLYELANEKEQEEAEEIGSSLGSQVVDVSDPHITVNDENENLEEFWNESFLSNTIIDGLMEKADDLNVEGGTSTAWNDVDKDNLLQLDGQDDASSSSSDSAQIETTETRTTCRRSLRVRVRRQSDVPSGNSTPTKSNTRVSSKKSTVSDELTYSGTTPPKNDSKILTPLKIAQLRTRRSATAKLIELVTSPTKSPLAKPGPPVLRLSDDKKNKVMGNIIVENPLPCTPPKSSINPSTAVRASPRLSLGKKEPSGNQTKKKIGGTRRSPTKLRVVECVKTNPSKNLKDSNLNVEAVTKPKIVVSHLISLKNPIRDVDEKEKVSRRSSRLSVVASPSKSEDVSTTNKKASKIGMKKPNESIQSELIQIPIKKEAVVSVKKLSPSQVKESIDRLKNSSGDLVKPPEKSETKLESTSEIKSEKRKLVVRRTRRLKKNVVTQKKSLPVRHLAGINHADISNQNDNTNSNVKNNSTDIAVGCVITENTKDVSQQPLVNRTSDCDTDLFYEIEPLEIEVSSLPPHSKQSQLCSESSGISNRDTELSEDYPRASAEPLSFDNKSSQENYKNVPDISVNAIHSDNTDSNDTKTCVSQSTSTDDTRTTDSSCQTDWMDLTISRPLCRCLSELEKTFKDQGVDALDLIKRENKKSQVEMSDIIAEMIRNGERLVKRTPQRSDASGSTASSHSSPSSSKQRFGTSSKSGTVPQNSTSPKFRSAARISPNSLLYAKYVDANTPSPSKSQRKLIRGSQSPHTVHSSSKTRLLIKTPIPTPPSIRYRRVPMTRLFKGSPRKEKTYRPSPHMDLSVNSIYEFPGSTPENDGQDDSEFLTQFQKRRSETKARTWNRVRTRREKLLQAYRFAPDTCEYEFEPMKTAPSYKVQEKWLSMKGKGQTDNIDNACAIIPPKPEELVPHKAEAGDSSSDEETLPDVQRFGGGNASDDDGDGEDNDTCLNSGRLSLLLTTPSQNNQGNSSQGSFNVSVPRSILKGVFVPARRISEKVKRKIRWEDEEPATKFQKSEIRKETVIQLGATNNSSASLSWLGNASEIDGPSPKNMFGFEHDMSNLQNAKALHQNQYLTTMSVEIHCDVRGDLVPDPAVDTIRAIFIYISNDVPEGHKKPKELFRISIRGRVGHLFQ